MNTVTFEEELARTGRLVYTNTGDSMLPFLRQGRDVLVIEKRDISDLRRYDVVLYHRPDAAGRCPYVLHRILKCREDGAFWIVGDNRTAGENVSGDNILGVLTAVKRGKKTVRKSSFLYRLYVALWCAPYPLRFFLLKLFRFCGNVVKGIKRRLKRK